MSLAWHDPTPDDDREPWRSEAKCLAEAKPTSWFFPDRTESVEARKTYCRTCPVQQDCLNYAIENKERFGIWGGTSEKERRKLRSERALRRHRP